MSDPHILVIDQSTSSSSAFVFAKHGDIVARASQEFPQYYPANGWVEHDAEEIWQSVITTMKQAYQQMGRKKITAIAITNQRETCVLWNKKTGKALHRAIVWQDRRTANMCAALKEQGHEATITNKTGLLLDPYFSASKISWLLQNTDTDINDIAAGTIDSWLIWRLTNGKHHLTDATNAARTSLYNIHDQCWDEALLKLFHIPSTILPEVKDSAAEFGETDILGTPLPLLAIAGDQQAAAIGQACFEPGMVKSTYGTGCFMLANTGDTAPLSQNRLLTTIAYRLSGKVTYALEGSIFMAGAIMQYLRDKLKFFTDTSESEALARAANPNTQAMLVPAFAGLGAPYWDAQARAAIIGLAQADGKAEITRAALMSVSLQSRDLLHAIAADMKAVGLKPPDIWRVDGGMTANNWLMQNLADMTGVEINRAAIAETTAQGAAFLAFLQAGIYGSLDEVSTIWQCDRQFRGQISVAARDEVYAQWQQAVQNCLISE